LAEISLSILSFWVLGAGRFPNKFLGATRFPDRIIMMPYPIQLLNRLEPSLLPEDQAQSVAASICRAITPKLKMYRIGEPTDRRRINGVAGLVCAFIDPEALTTISKHLWHKREVV
jgi:hypothetical protein